MKDVRSESLLSKIERLHPRLIDLSLDRILELLHKLGDPQHDLAPLFHIAGTNGKGSISAYLRALGNGNGLSANVMTSPHLISMRERFRIRDALISEDYLNELLNEIVEINVGAPLTVFEALSALGFLAFSRNKADLTILETGLGGRFDATNVVEKPDAVLISSIALDHQIFLGDTIEKIAFEKAGIVKPNVPVFCSARDPGAYEIVREIAEKRKAPFKRIGVDFEMTRDSEGICLYKDSDGAIAVPAPALAGAHQLDNAAAAIAAFKSVFPQYRDFSSVSRAQWPARIQYLRGELAQRLPEGWNLVIDGAHNKDGADALAHWVRDNLNERPLYVLFRCSKGRVPSELLDGLNPKAVFVVDEPDQENALELDLIMNDLRNTRHRVLGPSSIEDAVKSILETACEPSDILICGSLYLAGIALKKDGFIPS